MRKFIAGCVMLVLIFAVLACGNAPVPVDPGGIKPPPTTGAAAGGEPTTATPPDVTTTAATPTASLTPAPTPPTDSETRAPVCTLPACAGDEIYYCPGDCPGGCGTQCVTPTPMVELSFTPSPMLVFTLIPTAFPILHSGPPVIVSFAADKTAIVEDETLNVTWSVQGASEAALTWLGSGGTLEGRDALDPQGGTLMIAPHGVPVTLHASNSEGSTEAQLALTVGCAHAWTPELQAAPPRSGCPQTSVGTWAAQQPFEGGFMIWLESEQMVYVFFNDYGGKSYRVYPNVFQDGDIESDPNLVPPAGLEQPLRGFGQIWRDNPEVHDNLGWATAPESGFETWKQTYQGFGMHNITLWLKDIDYNINELTPMGSVWEVYSP